MKYKFLIIGAFLLAMTASAPRVFASASVYPVGSVNANTYYTDYGNTGDCNAFFADYGWTGNVYYRLNGSSAFNASIVSFCSGSTNFDFVFYNPSDGDYYFLMKQGGNPTDISDADLYVAYSIRSGVLTLISPSGVSSLTSVSSPADGATTTTSVTFSGTYFVSSLDGGNFLNFYVSNASDNSTTTLNNQYLLRIPVTQYDQITAYSTTTTVLDNSRYIWSVALTQNDRTIIDQIPFPDRSLSFYQFTTGSFDPTYGLSYDISSCNLLAFSGFDIQTCLYNLIFPNNFVFALKLNEAKEAYIRAWPIGYSTRFIELATGSSTEPLPELVISTPFGSFNLTPWNYLMGSTSILGTATSSITFRGVTYGTGETFREITEPYWNIFWYFLLGLAIITDLLGLRNKDNMN